MKPNIRTLNSLIISIILNITVLFLLAWLFQTKEKPEEEAIEISIFSALLRRQHSPTNSKRMIGQGSTSYSRYAAASASLRLPSQFISQTESDQASLPMLTDADLNGNLDNSFPIHSGKLQQNITTANISLESHGQQVRSWYSQGSDDRQSSGWQDSLLKGTTKPPLAQVEGSGKSIRGYFNISQVKYEDTSDVIRTIALRNLARSMNRWTMIETKVLPDPISLDDKKLFRVPLIYIASRDAFAFSHKERQNLRNYLYNGGFLLFSDISDEQMPDGPAANSIQFELWKILGNDYNLQPITPKHPLSVSFFDFSKSLPIETNHRQSGLLRKPLSFRLSSLRIETKRTGLLGISLANRLAVLYDASGYGLSWAKSNDKDDKALKFGVNIIVYALTVSLAK